jgi:proteic killer suppression protein
MIVSFRDGWLRDFFVEDAKSRKIPADLENRLFRKIQMIDDAATDQDLRVPPSNHFEKLRGNLEWKAFTPFALSAMAADFPMGWWPR